MRPPKKLKNPEDMTVEELKAELLGEIKSRKMNDTQIDNFLNQDNQEPSNS